VAVFLIVADLTLVADATFWRRISGRVLQCHVGAAHKNYSIEARRNRGSKETSSKCLDPGGS
jgi:hypothetical protein